MELIPKWNWFGGWIVITTAAIIAAHVATLPRTQLIRGVDMEDTQFSSTHANLRDNVHNEPIWVVHFGWHP